MRHLQLVGRMSQKVVKMASRCAWCRRWSTVADYERAHLHGAQVTHTICKACERKFYEQMDAAMPTKPPAA